MRGDDGPRQLCNWHDLTRLDVNAAYGLELARLVIIVDIVGLLWHSPSTPIHPPTHNPHVLPSRLGVRPLQWL